MLKKTITYPDYNGATLTEDFFFNLSEAEVMEMEMSMDGGLSNYLTRIVQAQNRPQIIKVFKELILKAYGEKSMDGKQFMKSDAISAGFAATEAYSQLFMELATDDIKAAEFVNGITPNKKSDSLSVVPPSYSK